jgi:N-acyl homoserine lactone hydrolase
MSAPVVEILLPGRALTTSEGSLGFCGTYLVTCAGATPRRILFDPGHAGRRAPLLSRMAERGLTERDIDTVVLSHAHWDHVQNVDLFPHATLWAHGAELEEPADDRRRDVAKPAWTSAMLGSAGVATVVDGQVLCEGVSVLHLPGHTGGSIGLRVETASGSAVLSGDAVSRRDVAQRGRCAIVHFDVEAGARSTRVVLEAADEVWPGHDRPFAVRNGQVGEYLSRVVDVEIVDHAIAR